MIQECFNFTALLPRFHTRQRWTCWREPVEQVEMDTSDHHLQVRGQKSLVVNEILSHPKTPSKFIWPTPLPARLGILYMDHLKKNLLFCLVLLDFLPGYKSTVTQITYQLSYGATFLLTNNPTTSDRQVWAMTKKNEYILPETNISHENGWLED